MKNVGILFVGFLTSFSALSAQGAAEYEKSKPCGEASVVSGDTCSNVKVEFKFAGCGTSSTEAKIAKRIICKGNQIKARYQEDGFRYEAEFSKAEDGWGGVSWKPLGPVQQWKKQDKFVASVQETSRKPAQAQPAQEPAPAKEPEKQAPSAPAAATLENKSLKFSAFFDFRFTNYSTKDNPNGLNPHAESGFGLEDGAIYANYEKENLIVVADLPFRRGKDVDYNPAATVPQQSANGAFVFGLDKAQLYLKYKAHENVLINAGQFDTIFGVELNDSKDRVFGKTGLVYDLTLPVTHTGVMVESSYAGAYFKAFAANPNNKGSYGTSATGDDNSEYGGAMGYSNEVVRGQVGYLARPISKADGSGYGRRTLLDAILGCTLGSFTLDLEYAQVADPSKNTLTAGDTSDSESAGTGMMALATYKFTEATSLGLRYEKIEKDPASQALLSADSQGVSLHHKVSSDLELRSEYIGYNFKNVAEQKWKDTRFSFSALVQF